MTAHTRPTETKTQTQAADPELIAIEAPFTIQRTETQRTARALYALGWNVFPVPNYWTRKAYHETIGNPEKWDPENKRPYIKALSYTRLIQSGFDGMFQERFWNDAPGDLRHCGDNLAVMAGRTSGNLCIIDADQNGDKVQAMLDRKQIPYWDYYTGRGHNFIVRIYEGEAANIGHNQRENEYKNNETPYRGVEIKGNSGYCVIPPSLHKTGSKYSWGNVDPTNERQNIAPVMIDELAWLGIQLRKNKDKNRDYIGILPDWTVLLAPQNRENLMNLLGGLITEGSRNSALLGPVYDLAAHVQLGDIGEGEALELLYQAGKCCDPEYPQRQIDYMWHSAINKRGLIPSIRPDTTKSRGQEVYNQARTFAAAHQWTGRTARTDRAVFLACAERGMLEGEPFAASCRNVAELAGCRAETASKAIRRLIKHGLIELHKESEPREEKPNRYKFTESVKQQNQETNKRYNTIQGEYTVPLIGGISPYNAIFAQLGIVALRCYEYLLEHQEPTIAALGRATDQHASSCGYAMKRLKRHGLVSAAEGVWRALELKSYEWQALAESMGLYDQLAARKKLHAIERENRYSKQMKNRKDHWKNTIRGNYETNEI